MPREGFECMLVVSLEDDRDVQSAHEYRRHREELHRVPRHLAAEAVIVHEVADHQEVRDYYADHQEGKEYDRLEHLFIDAVEELEQFANKAALFVMGPRVLHRVIVQIRRILVVVVDRHAVEQLQAEREHHRHRCRPHKVPRIYIYTVSVPVSVLLQEFFINVSHISPVCFKESV